MSIERTLFAAADKMRGAMDPGEYKHVALGLLFLRYISLRFEVKSEKCWKFGRWTRLAERWMTSCPTPCIRRRGPF